MTRATYGLALAACMAIALPQQAEAQRDKLQFDGDKKLFEQVPLEQLPRRPEYERVDPDAPPAKEIYLYRAILDLEVDGQRMRLSRIADCGGWEYRGVTNAADLVQGRGRRVFTMGRVLPDGSAIAARIPNTCPPSFNRDGSLPDPRIRQFHPDDRVTVFHLNNATNPTEIMAYTSPSAYSAPGSRIKFLAMRGEPAPEAERPDPPDQFAWMDNPSFVGAKRGRLPVQRWSAAVLIPADPKFAQQVASLRHSLGPRTTRPTLLEAIGSYTDERSGKVSTGLARQRTIYAKMTAAFATARGGSRYSPTTSGTKTRPEYGYPVWEGRTGDEELEAEDLDAAFSPVPSPNGMVADFRQSGLVRLYRNNSDLLQSLSSSTECRLALEAQRGSTDYPSTKCYQIVVDGKPLLIHRFTQRIIFPESHPNAWRFRVMGNWLTTYPVPADQQP
ncbi:MAG: hypothetical protein Alpg2KO_16230 [Alphaproteobacteria bacterium]